MSPDGRWFAVVGWRRAPQEWIGSNLWLVDAAVLEATNLTPGARQAGWDASFSPDATRLAFGSDSDLRLYLVAARTGVRVNTPGTLVVWTGATGPEVWD